MRKLLRRSLRAGVLVAVVAAASAATAPVYAEDQIYPPIFDPTRAIEERVDQAREAVEDTIPPTPAPPEDPFWSGITGKCLFQGATIEGAAAAVGGAELTGIVCRVYDEQGVMRGGCAVFLPGAAAACAAPTEVVLGPPAVCMHAYAVYPWDTYEEEHCE